MASNVLNQERLSKQSTEDLKQELLELTQDRDSEPISKKVQFYQNELEPLFTELSRRNPCTKPEDQVPLVIGVWSPIWSTIPFQDIIPGRIQYQSYQIFHNDGYYANAARYAPGNKLGWLQKISSILLAYDLMIVQKFAVNNGQWNIQNVAIKQAFRFRGVPFSMEKADSWFTKVVRDNSHFLPQDLDKSKFSIGMGKSTSKKLKTAAGAIPQFEHLYIDRDFRLVKSKREAKQRPSYTIAVRIK